jgi:hypothetical protein
MVSPKRRIVHIGAFLSILLGVTGCGQGALTTPASGLSPERVADYEAQSADSRDASRDLLVVGAGFTGPGRTLLFDREHKQIGTIPGPAGNYASDGQGTLYETPFENTNRLMIFDPPYHKIKTEITFKGYITDTVAVDPRTGVFAVALQKGSQFFVQFFKHGSVTSCAMVRTPVQYIFGLAFDREGTLFFLNAFPAIDSITGQCQATTMQAYVLPSSPVRYPENPLFFNKQDDLAFLDEDARTIVTYKHPSDGKFTQPVLTTTLQLPKGDGRDFQVLDCASSSGTAIWATYMSNENPRQVSEFRYPQGGKALLDIPLDSAYSCTTVPPLVP